MAREASRQPPGMKIGLVAARARNARTLGELAEMAALVEAVACPGCRGAIESDLAAVRAQLARGLALTVGMATHDTGKHGAGGLGVRVARLEQYRLAAGAARLLAADAALVALLERRLCHACVAAFGAQLEVLADEDAGEPPPHGGC